MYLIKNKDLKKLKDYEIKKDWLLNETIRNDDGIPGDFKKTVPEEIHAKNDKTRHNPLKNKNLSKARKDSRTDESPSSLGTTSFVISPNKRNSKGQPKEKASMDSMHNKSSNHTASEDPKRSGRKLPQPHMSSVSYPNSVHEEENKNNISINRNETKIEVNEVAPKIRMGTFELKDSTTPIIDPKIESLKEVEKSRGGEESVKLEGFKEGFEQEANKMNQSVINEKELLSVDKDKLNQNPNNQSSSQAINSSGLEESYNVDDGANHEDSKHSEEMENSEQDDQSFHEKEIIHSAGISLYNKLIIIILFRRKRWRWRI